MTENNLFQEVQDDLERQRYQALWNRYGPLLMVVAVLIIAGTAAYTSWKSWQTDKNQKASTAFIEIMRQDDTNPQKQIDGLEALAQKYPKAVQATIAQLTEASLDVANNQKDKGIALYDALSHDATIDPAFRQYADLMWIQLNLDSAEPALLEARLAPLTDPKAPWHFSAMEYDGYLALKQGDQDKARRVFKQIAQDVSAPPTLNARASDMVRYLGD